MKPNYDKALQELLAVSQNPEVHKEILHKRTENQTAEQILLDTSGEDLLGALAMPEAQLSTAEQDELFDAIAVRLQAEPTPGVVPFATLVTARRRFGWQWGLAVAAALVLVGFVLLWWQPPAPVVPREAPKPDWAQNPRPTSPPNPQEPAKFVPQEAAIPAENKPKERNVQKGARQELYLILGNSISHNTSDNVEVRKKRETEIHVIKSLVKNYPEYCLYVWPKTRAELLDLQQKPFGNSTCLGENEIREQGSNGAVVHGLWSTKRVVERLQAERKDLGQKSPDTARTFLFLHDGQEGEVCDFSRSVGSSSPNAEAKTARCYRRRRTENRKIMKFIQNWSTGRSFRSFVSPNPYREWRSFCAKPNNKCSSISRREMVGAVRNFLDETLLLPSIVPDFDPFPTSRDPARNNSTEPTNKPRSNRKKIKFTTPGPSQPSLRRKMPKPRKSTKPSHRPKDFAPSPTKPGEKVGGRELPELW